MPPLRKALLFIVEKTRTAGRTFFPSTGREIGGEEEGKRFREALLGEEEFVYTLELVPGRGSRGKTQDEILRLAEQVAESNLVHALSLTDNPGGPPAPSPDVI